ncbi:Ion transport [Lasiodiplodia theobromae]|uniref:Voltage-gated hydrogen channel 1 n=2 Tax=Lasiodiplodia TaxID=66739 RepID=A0A5N5DD53_9PEZI|nr:Ion transport [Lasiodiplodia theobromae]KAB2575092.1 Voltage-gated hydrogen channel 1 [Lasiodiplodia theobromae]KAF4538938.1 Ion transport [Lasiodiplodia theobromae]KAF9637373.1 Ion transport [Lasiodiplodia theobromae]KAK0654115.1 Voltage-gated hydrogen channel 1 [Lasiodiplodia hormozganensis]
MDEEDQTQPLLGSRRTFSSFADQNPCGLISPSSDSSIDKSRRQTQRFLTSKTGHYAVLALVAADVTCIFIDFVIQLFVCESHKANTGWNDALEALGIVSLVFSCLFMAELLASIWAFGLSYFNSKFHCLDAVVIIASFIVDLLLRGPLEEVATLVIVLRLWRVFKIIEELTAGAKEQLERLKEQIETLEHENAELREEVRKLRVD